MEHGFTWFGCYLGLPDSIATSLCVASLLIVFALGLARRLAAPRRRPSSPEDGFTVRNVAEMFVEAHSRPRRGRHRSRRGEVRSPAGDASSPSSWSRTCSASCPGFSPPTSDFNITFGARRWSPSPPINYYGARAHGAGYVKQFLGAGAAARPADAAWSRSSATRSGRSRSASVSSRTCSPTTRWWRSSPT